MADLVNKMVCVAESMCRPMPAQKNLATANVCRQALNHCAAACQLSLELIALQLPLAEQTIA